MKKYLIVLFTLFIFLLQGSVVHSQETGEHIEDYDVRIAIKQDGTVEIHEKILYDFSSLQKHGIIRNIPTIKTNKEGKNFRLEYSDVSVTDDTGNQYSFDENTDNNILSLKIGDPHYTVTGKHTYNIHCVVTGAFTYFSDHDELYWNIVGTDWEVPISRVHSEITLPEVIPVESSTATCFVGVEGSTSSACSMHVNGRSITISTVKPLQAGEGMTAAIGFKQGVVARIEPQEVVAFTDTWYGKILLKAGLVLFVLGSLFWYIIYPLWLPIKWYRHGRDPQTGAPVRAWFDPPQTQSGRKLSPAETGTLIDERAEMNDILGMIIDLARRRYYSIVEKEKEVFYLVKQKHAKISKDDTLLPFEKYFIDAAFANGSELKIKGADLVTTVNAIKDMLYAAMVKEDFFAENPEKIHNFYNGILGAAVITLNPALILAAWVFGRNMAKRTLFGAQQKDIALSLKKFLTSQERQLAFQANKQLFFEKLLPYAVVFGVEKIWAERFKEIHLQEPDWYRGYHSTSFNSYIFVSSMHNSFAQFTSAATPTTSSSGFSSGFSGGSSGGGGGGGGGGSW